MFNKPDYMRKHCEEKNGGEKDDLKMNHASIADEP